MNTPILNASASETVVTAIAAPAVEVEPSDTAKVIARLIGRATQLYTLPAVAVKVLELTNHPQVDSHALKECIENDPVLTTKVLRVVNSSLFALRRELSDLSQALSLLGTKPLKLLVLGFSLPTGLFAGVGASTLGWYWRRTLTKAVAAREICETVWRRPGDEAFIAALVQDLGMLLLIQELGAPYIDFLEKVRQRGYDVPALEAASIGFDHTALTAALVTHWGLPKAIVESVVWRPGGQSGEPIPKISEVSKTSEVCDGPSRFSGSFSVGSIVYLAEWVARLLADGRPEALGSLLATGRRDHHLAPVQLNALVETLEEKVRGLADVFSLELPQAADYRELLTLAHTRLADVAAEAAGDMLRGDSAASSLAHEMRSLGTIAARFGQRTTSSRLGCAARDPASGSIGSVPLLDRCRSHVIPTEENPVPAAVKQCHTADNDRGLLGRLAAAVAACRQARCPLSLLLVELGRADELVLTHGMGAFHQLRSALEKACRSLDYHPVSCLPHGEAGFAAVLTGCDRQLAVRLGNRLIEQVGPISATLSTEKHPTAAIGVGAATVCMPPKNFPAKDLIQAADRCLYGSHSSGGGVVKSIEIY